MVARLLHLGLLVASLSGCGPISATVALSEAEDALAAAREVDAATYAVYEFRRAELHLAKARLEEGYSEFQDAINLAKESKAFAEDARARALANESRGLELDQMSVPAPKSAPRAKPQGSSR